MSGAIVITGEAGALGAALARHLVARGYRVAGVGLRRHEARLRALERLLPRLVAHRSGSVVVVGSRNVERPWSGGGAAAYTVAKSAVVALARAVAADVLHAASA